MNILDFEEQSLLELQEMEITLASRQKADMCGVKFSVKCKKIGDVLDVNVRIQNGSKNVEAFKDYVFDLVTNDYGYSNDVRFTEHNRV